MQEVPLPIQATSLYFALAAKFAQLNPKKQKEGKAKENKPAKEQQKKKETLKKEKKKEEEEEDDDVPREPKPNPLADLPKS